MPSDSSQTSSPWDSLSHESTHRGVPGAWVVMGMFAFGALATGILFAYWHYHTAPFQELQAALANEFEGSRPRVEGGQRKQHKETPSVLRIVLKVEFHPGEETDRARKMVDRVLELAEEYHDLKLYDLAEIHLYWPEQEQEIHEEVLKRRLISP